MRTFGRDIYDGRISLEEADEDQSDTADEIENFKNKTRPNSPEKKNKEKKMLLIICITFLMLEKKFLVVLKAKYF